MKPIYYHIDEHRIAGSGHLFYRVLGWAFSTTPENLKISVRDAKGEDIPFSVHDTVRDDVFRAYHDKYDGLTPDVGLDIRVEHLQDVIREHGNKISICFSSGDEEETASTEDVQALLSAVDMDKPAAHVDNWVTAEGMVWINGWTYARSGACSVKITDADGNEIPCTTDRSKRIDLCRLEGLSMNDTPGFQIRIRQDDVRGMKKIYLHCCSEKQDETIELDITPGAKRNKSTRGFIRHVIEYTRRNGVSGLIRRAIHGPAVAQNFDYDTWFRARRVTETELEKQRAAHFSCEPKISVCIPLYNTRPEFLRDIVNSILAQSYQNWELCLADGSTTDEPGRIVADEYGNEPRIRYQKLAVNAGISGNTNAALKMATGDFIMLSDHDDLVEADAMYEIVRAINQSPDVDVVYTDEDVVNEQGTVFYDPHLKPDFSIDYLMSLNYITHIFVARKSIVDETGGFGDAYNGAQDWDMILRCCEKARRVAHVPKILYHWRASSGSTAGNPDSKMYAVDAGRRAVGDYMQRNGLDGRLEYTLDFICFHPILSVKKDPKVSIIICSCDHADLLKTCIDSILSKSTYDNYEILVVENNSKEQATFDYYEKIQKEDSRVRVVTYTEKGPFNYSRVNNFGAAQADGEYLIFLNNDTKVISRDWIEGMLGYCQRPDVGIVGAKLYYGDLTVQHCGIVIGMGGFAGHVLTGQPADSAGYMMLLHATHDVSAVTAACMMTKKQVFDEVGGFTEELRLALNDVDYCLKVRETGKLVVVDVAVELYHFESKSRGYEDTPERKERFKNEIRLFRKRWKKILDEGDPYYNPNLSLMYNDYRLREDNEHFDIIDEIEAEDELSGR